MTLWCLTLKHKCHIEEACTSLPLPTVLASSTFASAAVGNDRAGLVSIGRYALKGVERSQELFTLDRSLMGAD